MKLCALDGTLRAWIVPYIFRFTSLPQQTIRYANSGHGFGYGPTTLTLTLDQHDWLSTPVMVVPELAHPCILGSNVLRNCNAAGDPHRVILTGAVYKDVAAWLRRRRLFYPDNPSMFITRTGTDVSNEGLSMMLRRLNAFSGYGEGSFTSHTGRMGFACRKTASTNIC